jgi:misacylated tRNA(Ala) deacylase
MKSYDPQMHTAEHILNQTMGRIFGCDRSFSSHIEKKKSKCDYRFDRPLDLDEELELANEVNDVISRNLVVREQFMNLTEASQKFNLSRLPEESGDEVRIVTVGDYDACPCIGPHVKNTSEIGVFQLVSTSFESGILRIRFKLSQNIR